jgi:hypothetical protein
VFYPILKTVSYSVSAFCTESTPARCSALFTHSTINKMSHLFEVLVRGAKKVGFIDGLRAGHQEAEKELVDLREYVKDLEDRLHKEGNWRVAKVTQARREDNNNVREQRAEARPIRNITPAACRVVKSLAPAAIPPLIHSMNIQVNQNINDSRYHRSNPWGSISRRRGRHFRSRICTSQSNFRSRNTGYTQYTIPPLRLMFATDLVSSSLSFPVRFFSRFFHRDEGVATREGGTCVSGSRVPGIQ